MRRLRRLFSLTGIYLTAFMTLAAGVSHLRCVCPNGRVKPLCLSLFSQTSCCDASCCVAAAQTDQTCPSCCCRTSRRPDKDQGQQLGAPGCKKSLVDADAANLITSEAGQDAGIISWAALSEPAFVAPISALEAGSFAPSRHRPPPLDLTTLLQHINI